VRCHGSRRKRITRVRHFLTRKVRRNGHRRSERNRQKSESTSPLLLSSTALSRPPQNINSMDLVPTLPIRFLLFDVNHLISNRSRESRNPAKNTVLKPQHTILHLGVRRLLGLEAALPLISCPPDADPLGVDDFDVAFFLSTPFVRGSLALGILVTLQSGWRRCSGFTCWVRCSCDLDVVAIVVMAEVMPSVTRGFLGDGFLALHFLESRHLVIALVVPVELRGCEAFRTPGGGFIRWNLRTSMYALMSLFPSSGNMDSNRRSASFLIQSTSKSRNARAAPGQHIRYPHPG